MKKFIFVLIGILCPFFTAQAAMLKCEYSMSAAPLGTVNLPLDENGFPGEYADVSLFFAPMRKMPVTNVSAETGELLRLYLSKDDPSNELLMVVRAPANGAMKSTLFNAAAPAGAKELQGTCK
jgi:hypothetical protein